MKKITFSTIPWIALFFLFCFLSCEEEIPGPSLEFDTLPSSLAALDARFVKDMAYGEFGANTFDIILPNSSSPTPLIIFIHGGGFISGDKADVYGNFSAEIKAFVNQGIAFASINYRLLENQDQEGVLKPLMDSKRCLQYIRSVATNLNIDKDRIALSGGSAGAGTALWIGFHDDMKEANSSDPVLWESTRVLGVAAFETQASYDLQQWENNVFGEYGLQLEPLVNFDSEFEQRLLAFYGIDSFEEFDSEQTLAYREKVDMLKLLSRDDPEFWVSNTGQPMSQPTNLDHVFHHPYHARELLRKANSIGLLSYVSYGPVSDPGGESFQDYLIRSLKN